MRPSGNVYRFIRYNIFAVKIDPQKSREGRMRGRKNKTRQNLRGCPRPEEDQRTRACESGVVYHETWSEQDSSPSLRICVVPQTRNGMTQFQSQLWKLPPQHKTLSSIPSLQRPDFFSPGRKTCRLFWIIILNSGDFCSYSDKGRIQLTAKETQRRVSKGVFSKLPNVMFEGLKGNS